MTPTSQLRRHSLTYLVSKVVPGCAGLLSVTVFVRLYGYEQYGRYAIALALAITLSGWAAGWLSPGILRFQTSCCTERDNRLFDAIIYRGLVASVIAAVVVVAIVLAVFVHVPWRSCLVTTALAGTIVAYTVRLATVQANLRSR